MGDAEGALADSSAPTLVVKPVSRATSSDVPLLQEASLAVPTRHMPSWALLWVPRVGLSASDLLTLTLTSLRATAMWGLFL